MKKFGPFMLAIVLGSGQTLSVKADPLDAVADVVLGQPDFASDIANYNGVSPSRLFFPIGVAVDTRSATSMSRTSRIAGWWCITLP